MLGPRNAWSTQSPSDSTSLEAASPADPYPEFPPGPLPSWGLLTPPSPLLEAQAVALPLCQEGRVSRETEGGSAAKW